MIILFFSLFFSLFFMIFSFSSPPLFSSLFFASLFSPSPLSSLVLSLLYYLSFSFSLFRLFFSLSVFFLCLLSLSSFSVCWWCVCRRVVWCGVCRVVWHAENPVCRRKNASVCRFKTSPYASNTRTCVSTCARVAGIHGDVLNLHTEAFLSLHTGGRRQFSLPKTHARRVLTWSQRGSP